MDRRLLDAGIFSAISLAIFLTAFGAQSWADAQSTWKAAEKGMKRGPADIPILNQAVIKLPKNYGFIPAREAQAILAGMGDALPPGALGLLVPPARKKANPWYIAISYQASGFISDEGALQWNHEELLEGYKAFEEERNKQRRERGEMEWEAAGWVEKPQYDAKNRKLVWAVSLKDRGGAKSEDVAVNYNAITLGREGYVIIKLTAGLKEADAKTPSLKTLLQAVEFNPGKRYEDFDPAVDKSAGYGLAALVTGGAARKLGLVDMITALAGDYAMAIVVAVLALGIIISRRFSGERDVETTFGVRHD